MKNRSLLLNKFIFYSFLIGTITPQYFLKFSTLPEVLWMPTGIFQWLSQPLNLSMATIQVISGLWYLSATLSALNICFKFSSIVFAIVNLFVFNVAHNYGYQTHSFMAFVVGAFLLSLGRENSTKLMRALFCMIFFSAGVSKLYIGGWSWIFSDSLQNTLIRSEIFHHDAHPWANSFQLHVLIAGYPLFCRILAAGVIAIELLAPIALFKRSWAIGIVTGLLLMQTGIWFTILVNFKFYLTIYVFWIDWDIVLSWIKNKLWIREESNEKPI